VADGGEVEACGIDAGHSGHRPADLAGGHAGNHCRLGQHQGGKGKPTGRAAHQASHRPVGSA